MDIMLPTCTLNLINFLLCDFQILGLNKFRTSVFSFIVDAVLLY